MKQKLFALGTLRCAQEAFTFAHKSNALFLLFFQASSGMDTIKDLPNGKVEIKFFASDENFKKIEELSSWTYNEVTQVKICARRKSRVNVRLVDPAKRVEVFIRCNHQCKKFYSTKNLEVNHEKSHSPD